jgi:hypothetical protein
MNKTCLALGVAALGLARGAGAQGSPVGPEFRVNTHTMGSQEQAAVASDAAGDFVVAWLSLGQEGSGGFAGVFAQRFDASGVPLGPEFRVNTYTTDNQSNPKVAVDGSGSFVVVWESYGQDGSYGGVFGQRFQSSGAPAGPEFRVNTYTTASQFYPSVAADAAGGFVVVWSSFGQDGAYTGVFGQRFAAGGATLGPEFRVNTYTPQPQSLPSVASDAAGNFVVAWESYYQDASNWGVYAQRFSSTGAPLGSEFRVNTYTTGSQTYPSVAAAPAGDFVIAWGGFGQDGSNKAVVARRFSSTGAPLGPEFRVNSYTPGYQINPTVATDGAGNFVVAWQSNPQDGESYGIFGQRYASNGTPLGPEFRANTYTTDVQSNASVAASDAGDFVVVWRSYGQDGEGSAVIGQRYSEITPVSLTGFEVE